MSHGLCYRTLARNQHEHIPRNFYCGAFSRPSFRNQNTIPGCYNTYITCVTSVVKCTSSSCAYTVKESFKNHIHRCLRMPSISLYVFFTRCAQMPQVILDPTVSSPAIRRCERHHSHLIYAYSPATMHRMYVMRFSWRLNTKMAVLMVVVWEKFRTISEVPATSLI